MKKILILIGCFTLCAFNLNIVNSDRLVGFKIKHFGLKVDGTVGDFKGTLILDTQHLDYSDFNFSLGVKSLKTGMPKRDEGLMESEWFHTSKHPRISFKSTCFVKTADNRYTVSGILTIKDSSKLEEIPFILLNKNGNYYIKGEVKINRLNYDVGKKVMGMSDEVWVNFYLPLHSTSSKSIYTGR